ncbi:single-stranded DNA binding protein 30K chain [Acrodontium crateriforme]|uniref:Single-stranded DNA binding protein 30K chain n=1 Tax=Acrodontium crateriforme TaxID=150365 RepID=A0AAQ3M9K0_9PEZI|nr:single-stranded DNA binding protein 30K chain [Acrodontium crateriforme]
MSYGGDYSTTSYGAQGGGGGGGFMPGSQPESGGAKRSYGKDTLRPVTIKQLIEAHHPNPDAEHFMIDGGETTQVTFVGQIRNVSMQTTNITYKLDDGTGIIEVKVWIDSTDDGATEKQKQLGEQAYARVWGRLKAFNNKRHVGANIIRPITDFNEVSYHLLEATAVHLHFTRGPPESLQAKGGASGGAANGAAGSFDQGVGGTKVPPSASMAARKVFQAIKESPQTNEGLHMQEIASRLNMDPSEVMKAGEELGSLGLVYTTVDDHTWAILDV